jgi:6-phosphogluconolactonase
MERVRVYVGTYTGRGSKGIYAFEFNLQTGEASQPRLVAETPNPSFLAIHPSLRFLYAVNEIWGGSKEGTVSAFAIQPDGSLQFLNQQSSKGVGPCHLTVDKTGKFVLVANYGSGSVAVLPILPDGRLGEATCAIQHEGKSVNPQRQEGPHAHSINLDPANKFAIVADLGIDKLLVYQFDATKGTLKPNDPPFVATAPGAGPRHVAFHPNGKFVYAINELNSTVTAYRYDAAKGALSEIQTVSTLPEGFTGTNTTAEVQVHPSGRFLYGSNRGHDSIAIFAIDGEGKLTPIGHQPTQGKTPRNFGIDPTGTYLLAANQDSDNLVVFRINSQTGKLELTGLTLEIPTPVCVKFLPLNAT